MMIATTTRITRSSHGTPALRNSVALLQLLFALLGAIVCAAAAYVLDQSFGMVVLAYVAGGNLFYLLGALLSFLARFRTNSGFTRLEPGAHYSRSGT
ncbi:hypothetical protein [Roseinatronobacter alkalisoli]|uniref:Uncharacterized protein n=1 Tax=Roseinatronobacter alkalisoli TaxID=3028235 RepID=A0ABT5T574_9RHOB|nr:hypothetical protein [Roseinatronobacter sp. HJB301]MDD7970270.1 hypothetical protein [Roseinatronobacter sp. HJB301]